MELSLRLKTIADMVSAGNVVADVGCDHGFVSIYLYENHIAPKVYAMDLREGPLLRAKEHILKRGFEEAIETRLSDGVLALQVGEADAIVCAGMGGRLMAKILEDGMEKVKAMKELILAPQSDLAFFRGFLREWGFGITKEAMVKEDGKYYPVIKATYGSKGVETDFTTEAEDTYGPCLLQEKNPVLIDFLESRYRICESILAGIKENHAIERKAELTKELEMIQDCLLKLK